MNLADLAAAEKYNATNAVDVTPDSALLAGLVEGWQAAAGGLTVDGKFGPKTRASVYATLPIPTPPVLQPKPKITLVDWIPGLFPDDVEARWARISKLAIKYLLGAGGRDPHAQDPRTWKGDLYGCDCTGADSYCSGLDRYQPNFTYYGGWMNTDAIVADALGNQEVWELLDRPVRGCGLVFCGIDYDHDGDRERIGHKAWSSKVDPSFDPKKPDYRLVTIWDCAGTNSERPGAVGDVFKHDGGYFNGKETYRDRTDPRWATHCVWNKATGRPA
jgi:hypothetical protein